MNKFYRSYLFLSRTFYRIPITLEKAHEIIRDLRKKYKYTQEDVAKWLGISRPSYAKKETGKQALFADEFITILNTLNKLGPNRKRRMSTDPILAEILSKIFS